MPYMAETLVEYSSFKRSIQTLISRNTWQQHTNILPRSKRNDDVERWENEGGAVPPETV